MDADIKSSIEIKLDVPLVLTNGDCIHEVGIPVPLRFGHIMKSLRFRDCDSEKQLEALICGCLSLDAYLVRQISIQDFSRIMEVLNPAMLALNTGRIMNGSNQPEAEK